MNTIQQEPVIAIGSSAGKKVANTNKPFMLVLQEGENLFEGILRCANDAHLQSATLSGLGGLFNITVAYYNHETYQYQTKLFTEMHELISINGNITRCEGKLFLHVHAALGNEKYEVIGGHIMDATVNPTAEISIVPFPGIIDREADAKTGLKMICPIK
jgi:predicted DNA-binding protein with PD1-like motif